MKRQISFTSSVGIVEEVDWKTFTVFWCSSVKLLYRFITQLSMIPRHRLHTCRLGVPPGLLGRASRMRNTWPFSPLDLRSSGTHPVVRFVNMGDR